MSLTRSVCLSPPAGKKGVKKDKDLKLERALEAFTTGAIDELPKLLSQYQTNPDKVVSLVKLPQYLQRDTIDNKRNKEAFNTLLGLLRSIYTKAIDENVRPHTFFLTKQCLVICLGCIPNDAHCHQF